MKTYRELNLEIPKDIESVKESVHRFAKDSFARRPRCSTE